MHYCASLPTIKGTMLLMKWLKNTRKGMLTSINGGRPCRYYAQTGYDGKPWYHVRYGQGKLANTMDITKDEATDLLKQYHNRVPFVKGLDMVAERADAHGQIRTILGRLQI